MILYSSFNNRRRVGGLPTRSLIVSHHQLSPQISPKIVSSYLILTINLDLHLPTKWCGIQADGNSRRQQTMTWLGYR